MPHQQFFYLMLSMYVCVCVSVCSRLPVTVCIFNIKREVNIKILYTLKPHTKENLKKCFFLCCVLCSVCKVKTKSQSMIWCWRWIARSIYFLCLFFCFNSKCNFVVISEILIRVTFCCVCKWTEAKVFVLSKKATTAECTFYSGLLRNQKFFFENYLN